MLLLAQALAAPRMMLLNSCALSATRRKNPLSAAPDGLTRVPGLHTYATRFFSKQTKACMPLSQATAQPLPSPHILAMHFYLFF